MRNCKWTNSTVRVMVQGFKKGVFEGNTFTRIGQGLAVTMDSWWWEGGTWDECLIRDNTFTQTPYVTCWDSSAIHYGPGIPDNAEAIFGQRAQKREGRQYPALFSVPSRIPEYLCG